MRSRALAAAAVAVFLLGFWSGASNAVTNRATLGDRVFTWETTGAAGAGGATGVGGAAGAGGSAGSGGAIGPPATNLLAWFKADVGVTRSGSDVTAWADQSGHGNDVAAIGGTDPPQYVASAINGLPGISFGGPSGTAILGNLTTGLVAANAPRYVVAVVMPLAATGPNAGQTFGGDYFTFRKAPNLNCILGDYGFDYVSGTTWETNVPLVVNTGYVVENGSDGTTLVGTINGTSLTLSGTSPETDTGADGFFIGSDFEYAQGSFWGYISEVEVYSAQPSPTDLTALRAYEHGRYAIP